MYDVIRMKEIARDLNDLTFTDYYYRLMLIARSRFAYENLPNGIDEKWIEQFLYTEGKCMFFKDKENGFMVTKCNPASNLNFYDEPILLRGYGTGYMGEPLENNEECILIRNNDEMLPTYPTVQLYAMRLAEISRTIDINIHAQKTPVLILCSEKQRMTMKNVYKQWAGNEPFIFGDKNMDVDGIRVLNTQAPIVFDKLQIQKHNIWNECMTFLGINNANQDKRERLVSDEVSANNSQIEMNAQVCLKSRERAVKLINEKFNLDIKVRLRTREEMNFRGLEEEMND